MRPERSRAGAGRRRGSRLGVAVLAAALLTALLTAVPAPAATAADAVPVYLNDAPLQESGVLQGGYTMVPMRCIFEALGAAVSWDGATRTVTATTGDKVIRLTVGSLTAYMNDFPLAMAAVPCLISGRTYVPLRFVAEALGATVSWDAAARRVDIRCGPPPPPKDPYLTGYQPSITLADYQDAKDYASRFERSKTPEFDVPYERFINQYGWYTVAQLSTPWARSVYQEWLALRERETVADADVDELINEYNGKLNLYFYIVEEGETEGDYHAVLVQNGRTVEPTESALEGREEAGSWSTGSTVSSEGTSGGFTYRWYVVTTRFTFDPAQIDVAGQIELRVMAPGGEVRAYYWDLRTIR